MHYLHTMVRVRDLDASLRFYCEGLGLTETRRMESEQGRFTLIYLAAPETPDAEVELTWNWPDAAGNTEDYGNARNFSASAMRRLPSPLASTPRIAAVSALPMPGMS